MFYLMKQMLQHLIFQFNFNREKIRKSEVICIWIYILQKLNNLYNNTKSNTKSKIEVNHHKNIYHLK